MKTYLQYHFPAEPYLVLEVWVAPTAKQNVSRRRCVCPLLPVSLRDLAWVLPQGRRQEDTALPCWSIQAGVAGKECGEVGPEQTCSALQAVPHLLSARQRLGPSSVSPESRPPPGDAPSQELFTVGRTARPRAAGIGNGDDLIHKGIVSPNTVLGKFLLSEQIRT